MYIYIYLHIYIWIYIYAYIYLFEGYWIFMEIYIYICIFIHMWFGTCFAFPSFGLKLRNTCHPISCFNFRAQIKKCNCLVNLPGEHYAAARSPFFQCTKRRWKMLTASQQSLLVFFSRLEAGVVFGDLV